MAKYQSVVFYLARAARKMTSEKNTQNNTPKPANPKQQQELEAGITKEKKNQVYKLASLRNV